MAKLIVSLILIEFISHGSSDSTRPTSDVCKNWRPILDKAGKVCFIAGNRQQIIPESMAQVDTFCIELLHNSNIIRNISRSCLKPFPKQVISTFTHGIRKTNKRICSSVSEKNRILEYGKCLVPPAAQGLLHDMGDQFTRLIENIRDVQTDLNKKIPLVCCSYQDFKRKIRNIFPKYCSIEAIEYTINLVDSMVEDALDLVCHQHMSVDAPKCIALAKSTPINVPESYVKQSEGFFLPLTDVFVEAGEAPIS